MELDNALGKVLRKARKVRGLSQEALAHAAEVERNYISLIELGKHSPSVRIVFKLCAVLGISPWELIRATEDQVKESTNTPGTLDNTNTKGTRPD